MKKMLSLLLTAALALSLAVPAMAAESAPVVILHTNDVHTATSGYAAVAAYRQEMEEQYGADRVTLVDAGDAIQGGPIGTLTEGASLVDIMNYVGYDYAIPGNHEFDYGMDVLLDLAQNKAQYTYLSCNLLDQAGKSVFAPYAVEDYGDVQVAYVGISTPETLTKSNPTHFQDDSGNYIYSFCEGDNGSALYTAVQNAVDSARKDGADYVVALAHLGMEGTTSQWTASAVIANTKGIDLMIDGHSHEMYQQQVSNLDGEAVDLVQTGTQLANLGCITLDPATGEFTTEMLSLEGENVPADPDTQAYLAQVNSQFEEELNQVVGSTTVELKATAENGYDWAVRVGETNLGDLVADAYRWALGADIGLCNGGGVRADIPVGDITYQSLLSVQPYGNELCLVEATGQEVLDALEMGARLYPESSGGFLQVSGLTFTIDASIPSSVQLSDQGAFQGVTGPYRVSDVKVNGQPLELDKVYTVASHNYLIKSGGDGFTMFQDNTLLKDCVILDNQSLITFFMEGLNGQVGQDYQDPAGQGRITILNTSAQPQQPEEPEEQPQPEEPEEQPQPEQPQNRTYTVQKGDSLWRIAAQELGSGKRWQEIYELNRDLISNPSMIFVGQELKLPQA